MILPYTARLICLCLACFGLAQMILGVVAWGLADKSIRAASRLKARTAARLLLALRLLPAGAGVFVMAGLCLPSYLWLEEESAGEPVSGLCLAVSILGAVIVGSGVVRAVKALWHSPRVSPDRAIRIEGQVCCVVETTRPLLALTGIIRSRVLLSPGVMEGLPANELALALDHERAHRISRDNLKRLLLQLAPLPIPALDRAWLKYSEWAADDAAAQGDAQRSLTLASALVHFSRLNAQEAGYPLSSCLLAEEHDLAARVGRLLATPAPVEKESAWLLTGAVGAGLLGMLVTPGSLTTVHTFLESLIH